MLYTPPQASRPSDFLLLLFTFTNKYFAVVSSVCALLFVFIFFCCVTKSFLTYAGFGSNVHEQRRIHRGRGKVASGVPQVAHIRARDGLRAVPRVAGVGGDGCGERFEVSGGTRRRFSVGTQGLKVETWPGWIRAVRPHTLRGWAVGTCCECV